MTRQMDAPTDEVTIVQLLSSIDRRLALLTARHERDLRAALEERLLKTKARVGMFQLIDGRAGAPAIANKIGVSDRAVQVFIKEMLELGLVKDTGTGSGRSVIVAKDEEAIVQWYLGHAE